MESASSLPVSSELQTVSNTKPHPAWAVFVQCNPFYLASALLLIYSVYRLAIDPNLFGSDTTQILFNFGALELYSAMLVVAAIFLARRGIAYDSTLLFFLENILVLIPFMLISHSAFLEAGMSWNIALTGAALVCLRFGAFARLMPSLNLPRELLGLGALLLAFNIAVPLLFRAGLEKDSELWTSRAMYCWYVALPLIALLGRILPRARRIPIAVFLIWMAGSATHLGTIGYVDDQTFTLKLIVPLLWAIAWLLCDHIADFIPTRQLLLAPAAIPALALLAQHRQMFLALCGINAVIFTVMFLLRRQRFTLNLAIASSAAIFLFLPADSFPAFPLGLHKWNLIYGMILLVGFLYGLRTRNARGGLLGSACLGMLLGGLTSNHPWSGHLALQAAIIFHILHSFRWTQPLESGSNLTLGLAALALIGDAFVLRKEIELWTLAVPLAGGIVTLVGIVLLERKITARALILGGCAIAAMILRPTASAGSWILNAPPGALALIASFLLFGVGTLYALRSRKLSNSH